MKKNIKISRIMYYAFVAILFCLFIYSSYRIILWKKNNERNKVIKESLQKYIVVEKDQKYNIDFKGLKEKNNDTVGYVRLLGTNIDYVVVRGSDNEFYLNHNFNKEKNISGWIFMDYKNKLDGSDKNIVIFGHNTKDDSMFGSLKNTLTKQWYENKNNHRLLFIDENGLNYYNVFSSYKIENEEYYIKTDFSSEEDYKEFLKVIKERSVFDYNVEVNENDSILTLSSCSDMGAKRVVLHAKKVGNN